MTEIDIFISYNWNTKDQVKILYDHLKLQNYNIWLDDKELNAGNSRLTTELAQGIKRSKIFLCCITNDYCKSYNCNLECEFASAKKKPIIPLMIQKIETTDIDEIQITDRDQTSGIGFIITYVYLYKCIHNRKICQVLNF